MFKRIVGSAIEKRLVRKVFDSKDSIVVVGSPRSGTTWIFELCCQLPGRTGIFEPLHPDWFPEVVALGLAPRPAPPKDRFTEAALQNYVAKALAGNLYVSRAHYPKTMSSLVQRLTATALVIKFVRATRLLAWLDTNVGENRLVYVHRDPIETIKSQLTTGYFAYNKPGHKEFVPAANQLAHEASQVGWNKDAVDVVANLGNKVELLSAAWLLDNGYAHRSSSAYRIDYGQFCKDPVKHFTELAEWLRVPMQAKRLQEISQRPSITSAKEASKRRLGDQADSLATLSDVTDTIRRLCDADPSIQNPHCGSGP